MDVTTLEVNESQLDEKDREIEDLEKTIERREVMIQGLVNGNTDRDAEIERLRARVAEWEGADE